MGGVRWTGVTIALKGLSPAAARVLERRVSGFQQARRHQCLSLLQPGLQDDGLIRRLARDARLAAEARAWADWLVFDPDVLDWYRRTLAHIQTGIWQREGAFFAQLSGCQGRSPLRSGSGLWGWHPRHGLDLRPWLGRHAEAVELEVPAGPRYRLTAPRRPILGQWLYWQGAWLIHLFVPQTARQIGPLPYVAAALLVPPLAGASGEYQVRQGDTLWGIAAETLGEGRQWRELYAQNRDHVADPHWIYPGQRLVLPGQPARAGSVPDAINQGAWVVRPGDTLWSIAVSATGQGGNWPGLWQANRSIIPHPGRLSVGLRLRWPVGWALPIPGERQAKSAKAKPTLQQALRQRPVGRTVYPQAPAVPPVRFLLPGTPPVEASHDERPAPVAPAAAPVGNAAPVVTPPEAQPGESSPTALPAEPLPIVVPPESAQLTLPADPAPHPVTPPVEPIASPSLPPLPASGHESAPALHPNGQPATPLNRLDTTVSPPPAGESGPSLQDGAVPAASDLPAQPAEVAVSPPVAADDLISHSPAPGSDPLALPSAEPVPPEASGDGDDGAIAVLPSVAPTETEAIMPAAGGTDPWEHWLHPGQRPPASEHSVTFAPPLTAPKTLWPRLGYQVVPEHLSESGSGAASAKGWAVNRQRLDAEWGWGDWLVRGHWTFGRYEMALDAQTVSRQESWVDLELGRQWRPLPELQLSLLGRGTWWSRRGAGPGQLGLLAADLQGFGLGPVGALNWSFAPGQSVVVEAAALPLMPVTFSGAAQASGQVGQIDGYVGWRGQWGMWRPHLGYRGRWLYDADGTYSQLAHGMSLGLSLGWGAPAITAP